MQVINGAERWLGSLKPLVLALGNFDGVHKGHQTILKTAVEKVRSGQGSSAALIFDPHPVMLLRPQTPFALLTDIADRAELMSALGLDYLIVQSFSEEMASLSPEQFVRDYLLKKLRIKGVVVGNDYSFGAGGAGKSATMESWGEKFGFDVTVCPLLQINGKTVSSSTIRELLRNGAVEDAAQLLQYYFFRRGKVVRGKGLGTKVVYPTANINVDPPLLWPGKGVYLTAVRGLGEKLYFGVTNVGSRPTFGRKDAAVETHILDFQGDLYSRELCLYFLTKLRETRTFNSPEGLKEQVDRDIERSRQLITDKFINLQAPSLISHFLPAVSC